MKRWSALLLLLVCSCDTFSGPETTEPLDVDVLLDHLNYLAGDSLYGRGSGTEHELEAAEYIRDEFDEYGLLPGGTDWFQPFLFESRGTGALLPSQNVLGVLPGEGELSGQWVILGAHYDHIGFTQVAPDSIIIFNGADDNASGTALMLEVARYLSEYFDEGGMRSSDRRSLMFQAYGAEEAGLRGSRYFASNPTVPIDSITSMVNLDMIGRLRHRELYVLGGLSSTLWGELLPELNEDNLDLIIPPDAPGRSDHVAFLEWGIPATFLYTGTHEEYHQPDDDVPLINTDGMLLIGDLTVDVLVDLVTRPQPPVFMQ